MAAIMPFTAVHVVMFSCYTHVDISDISVHSNAEVSFLSVLMK